MLYSPQLATLVTVPPTGEAWWHEIKFDGYRIGAALEDGRVRLLTRNGNDWTRAFQGIAEAVEALPISHALIDGEVAVLLPDGRTSFQALQHTVSGTAPGGGASLVYFVFDLLRLDGRSIESRPLTERKALLEALAGADTTGRLRVSEHLDGSGRELLANACGLGFEGIVSKRIDRPYYHGRNSDWVKAKCTRRQELVIGGFTDPEGARAGLGAVLAGHYDGTRLVFAGKVGTGFTQTQAKELRATLEAIETRTCPFEPPPPPAIARRAHWVRPELVCEVSFSEWTGDGRVRHPSFQGLRRDKPPHEVRRERPT